MLLYLYWNPERVAFNIFNISVYWYSIFFATGFFIGYYIFLYLLKKYLSFFKDDNILKAKKISDRMTTYMVIFTIIGARLGHIIFYENISYYFENPLNILNLREGGLASHGAAIFIIVGLIFFCRSLKKEKIPLGFISVLDLLAVPTALAASLIRIGNFFNQEILGKETNIFLGVVFGSPSYGKIGAIRHPVQLYESIFYLFIFFILFYLHLKKDIFLNKGKSIGIFLISVFSFRFFIEFLKVQQSVFSSFLLMGQYLSIPFIILGIFFILKKDKLLNVY